MKNICRQESINSILTLLKVESTLIHNLRLSSIDLNAINRQSAAHTATSSHSTCAIGLTSGFNSLIKNSLNVCKCESQKDIFFLAETALKSIIQNKFVCTQAELK